MRGRPFPKGQSGNPAGRPRGAESKITREMREAATRIVTDPEYLELLQKRVKAGEASPHIEQMLWHYAAGKPPERVELDVTGGIEGRPDPEDMTEDEIRRELVENARMILAQHEEAEARRKAIPAAVVTVERVEDESKG